MTPITKRPVNMLPLDCSRVLAFGFSDGGVILMKNANDDSKFTAVPPTC